MLVPYTSQLQEDTVGTVGAFRAAQPGATREWIHGGTDQALPRLFPVDTAQAEGEAVRRRVDTRVRA